MASKMLSTLLVCSSVPLTWRSRILNSLVLGLMGVLAMDAAPSTSRAHQRLKQWLDPALDVTGLWQGGWELFAPEADSTNVWIEAVVHYDDHSTWRWRTVDWMKRNWFERLTTGRHPKFSDYFRLDSQAAVRPHLARYVASLAPVRDRAKPRRVELYRYWWIVPKPSELAEARATFSSIPPPQDEFKHYFNFHTEHL